MNAEFANGIILDRCLPAPMQYCWFEDWFNPYESAYSLLSKFAFLNAMTAREMVRLFLSRRCRQLSRQEKNPNVDLSSSALLDVDVIASQLRVSPESLDWAFLYPKRSAQECQSEPFLRYCPRCLVAGFHSSLYQWNLLVQCPLHRMQFKEKCKYCGGKIPYVLMTSTFAKPFRCPHCNKALAAVALRNGRGCIQWAPAQINALANVAETLALKQRVIDCSLDLDRYFSNYRPGHYRLAPMQLERKKTDYLSFLDHVMARWRHQPRESQGSGRHNVHWLHHNGYVFERSARAFFECTVTARRDTAQWTAHDEAFWEILPIYKSIRRYIWRHLLNGHRSCVSDAAATLWWSIDGNKTHTICPVTYAFLQWRMFWEGFSTPQSLFNKPNHVPFRLLAWLSDTAPICANHWPSTARRWLTHRIFAVDCLNNYFEWVRIARMMQRRQQFNWSRNLCQGHQLTYWAAAGSGHRPDPVTLGIEGTSVLEVIREFANFPNFSREHRRWHREQLKQLRLR